MADIPNSIDQLNALKEPQYSQGDFERHARAIIAQTETPGSIGAILSEGIKKDPVKASENFYQAIKALKDDHKLQLPNDREQQLLHLARVVIIESLGANGYEIEVSWDTYKLNPEFPKDKEYDLLSSIWIKNLDEIQKIMNTIEEHKQPFTEKLIPQVSIVWQASQTQRQILALQIDTWSPKADQTLRSTTQWGSFWDSIFGDWNISRNLNENTGPIMALAASLWLAKLFGFFDFKFGEDPAPEQTHPETHDTAPLAAIIPPVAPAPTAPVAPAQAPAPAIIPPVVPAPTAPPVTP